MRKLNNTLTGTAKSADYHIKFMGGQYRVFDKAGRFRLSFATLPAAQTYIDLRTTSHKNALSDGLRQAQATEVAA